MKNAWTEKIDRLERELKVARERAEFWEETYIITDDLLKAKEDDKSV